MQHRVLHQRLFCNNSNNKIFAVHIALPRGATRHLCRSTSVVSLEFSETETYYYIKSAFSKGKRVPPSICTLHGLVWLYNQFGSTCLFSECLLAANR